MNQAFGSKGRANATQTPSARQKSGMTRITTKAKNCSRDCGGHCRVFHGPAFRITFETDACNHGGLVRFPETKGDCVARSREPPNALPKSLARKGLPIDCD